MEYITTCNPMSSRIFQPGLRLTILGKIENEQHSFVIDTGATASIINVEKLPPNIKLNEINNNVKLVTANGSDLILLGIVEFKLELQNTIFPTQCIVVKNLVGPSLLGTDFLKLYHGLINFQNEQIKLSNNEKLVVIPFNNVDKYKSAKIDKENCSGFKTGN
jgi:predicted aspartyl protease